MKRAKQLLCLLLCAVLCLSLAACASKEDKAFDEACALLEAGDYDGAIAAFSAIGRYQEISGKIAEAEALRAEQERTEKLAKAGFLVGTWNCIDVPGVCVTFTADGNCTAFDQFNDWDSMEYNYDNGVVQCVLDEMAVGEYLGVPCLIAQNYGKYPPATHGYRFIKEEDFETVGPQTIEITTDNWTEYFELREANNVNINEFGEIIYSVPGYGIFLKDEYYDLLIGEISVDFELTYDEACFKIADYDAATFNGDLITDYTLVETKPPRWWDLKTGCTSTASVYDRRYWNDQEADPYNQMIAAQFYTGGYWSSDNSNVYYCKGVNPQLSRAQGSLTLLRG